MTAFIRDVALGQDTQGIWEVSATTPVFERLDGDSFQMRFFRVTPRREACADRFFAIHTV